MNGNVKKIFDEIEPPDDLHEAVGAELQRKRSVKMNKNIGKKAAVIIAATLCLALLCAAGWPVLRENIWGKSATVQESEDGKTAAIEQSVFDPASYRMQSMRYNIYFPTEVLGDPEAEIMTVFDDLEKLETSPFAFYEQDGSEIDCIKDYRLDIGSSIEMVGPWSEFTLTRKDANTFTMLDSEGYGFTYYIYPMTGDTVIDLDYTPTGFILPPDGNIKTVENGGDGFTVKGRGTAVLGNDTETHKKGERVRYKFKFKNVSEDVLGKDVEIGFYLDPSDPQGETEGPAYREGDGWFYPITLPVDEYETTLTLPLKFSGEYRFALYNMADGEVELEYFTAEVVEEE